MVAEPCADTNLQSLAQFNVLCPVPLRVRPPMSLPLNHLDGIRGPLVSGIWLLSAPENIHHGGRRGTPRNAKNTPQSAYFGQPATLLQSAFCQASFREARVHQGAFQANSLLQELVHPDRVGGGRSLEFPLHVFQPTPQVNAAEGPDR